MRRLAPRPSVRRATMAVSLRLLAACVGAVLLAGAAGAQTPPQNLQERFRTADKNGDGKIDREEFLQRTIEVFYFTDAARRGYLIREQITQTTDERFRTADANRDGRISLEEFLAARHRDFEAADTNGDGVVTFEEVEVYFRTRP